MVVQGARTSTSGSTMAQIDPSAPQPGDPVIFNKFDGIKNTVQPERLGPRDLVRARDVVLDDSGQISRRRGFTQVVSGDAHSLFSGTGITLVVLNGSLCALHPDYSTAVLVTGVGSDPSKGLAPLSYAQVGPTVYYSGPTDSGRIDVPSLTASPWGAGEDLWLSPVVNPTATLPAIAGRLLGKPPNATALAYLNGRILLAQSNVLWATVLYTYNYVDKNAGYVMFEGEITMVGAVADGVYVGTDEGLYFLSASTPWPWKKVRVMDSPVIPGSMVYIPGELGNPPQTPLGADTPLQVSIAFMTSNGFCVAQDAGQTVNLTESKVFFPGAVSAASGFIRRDGLNQFITALQSGGDPTTSAAIGDKIEATLIRGPYSLMGS